MSELNTTTVMAIKKNNKNSSKGLYGTVSGNVVGSTNDNAPTKKKHKFKMPSSMAIILGVVFSIIFLTWVFAWAGASVDTGTWVAGTYTFNWNATDNIWEITNGLGEAIITLPGLASDPSGAFIRDGATITITQDKATELNTVNVEAVGILAIGGAFVGGFADAAGVIFYLFVLGALIEVMLRSGAMEKGVNSLIKKIGKNTLAIIPILFCIFSLGGTTYGMQEETIGFFIIVIPFLIVAGFDAMTGLLVILLGSTTGFMMSTINPFAIGAAVDAASSSIDISMSDGLGFRFLAWGIATALGATLVTLYARRVYKDPTKSFVAADHQKNLEWAQQNFKTSTTDVKLTKREFWGLMFFLFAFVVMIVMFLPWYQWFDVAWGDGYAWDANYVTGLNWLFGGSEFGHPGNWYFAELVTWFILVTIGCALIFGMNMKQTTEAAWAGAKSIFTVAILIGIARSISVILEASSLDTYIIYSLASGLGGVGSMGFVYIMFFMFMVMAIFIPSTSGLASASMGLVGGIVAGLFGTGPEGIETMAMTIFVFSAALGLINMFIPTQAIVLASCEASHVPYGKMLKPVGMYMGIMMALVLVLIPLGFAMM